MISSSTVSSTSSIIYYCFGGGEELYDLGFTYLSATLEDAVTDYFLVSKGALISVKDYLLLPAILEVLTSDYTKLLFILPPVGFWAVCLKFNDKFFVLLVYATVEGVVFLLLIPVVLDLRGDSSSFFTLMEPFVDLLTAEVKVLVGVLDWGGLLLSSNLWEEELASAAVGF